MELYRKDKLSIRMAETEDAERLLEIYGPYVTDTVITFEYTVPSKEEFQGRIQNISEKYPYLVAELDGKIVGYAYATPYKSRAAYQWSVETSIYIDKEYHRIGAGTALYTELFKLLEKQKIRNLYACVTLPNEKSQKLHEKFGFELIGRFHRSGYKLNDWHDIGWFEKKLEFESDVPEVVRNIKEVL
ncbi:GNAT family N-acetyltransferase [[Clostridium] polysaccharolyticum]|uniref:Phosphinothricin acetyltransferase n=1 Tax=[Clostridium] polysaccharolyticum TaxID=29364 RepID=A0A1I0CKP5_9FIRM|nr:GNAT family N-acetyltransferase [[Clostridium] polysaccharolyticum]SET19553.1 phosphinothricin acetyltransferase [[Clostridium] polysaccharolyticum]